MKSGGTIPPVQKVGVPVPFVPPKLRLCVVRQSEMRWIDTNLVKYERAECSDLKLRETIRHINPGASERVAKRVVRHEVQNVLDSFCGEQSTNVQLQVATDSHYGYDAVIWNFSLVPRLNELFHCIKRSIQ